MTKISAIIMRVTARLKAHGHQRISSRTPPQRTTKVRDEILRNCENIRQLSLKTIFGGWITSVVNCIYAILCNYYICLSNCYGANGVERGSNCGQYEFFVGYNSPFPRFCFNTALSKLSQIKSTHRKSGRQFNHLFLSFFFSFFLSFFLSFSFSQSKRL